MLRIPSQQRFTSIQEFQIVGEKVGCGSFGVVRLARHRNTCRMYALKIIDLKDMPSEAQAKLVEREIRLHSQLDHPHIIKLWDTIVEGDLLYMVMEYAEQGNLFAHQNTKNIFNQSQAFKFFSQTLQGLKYLHQQNIIHRDIKPENLLLDATGNVKICDFGWCAEDITAKRTTFCGTYQYMAPEMLFNSQYDYRVDIWGVGVLLYQMLHGEAPFKGKSTNEVKEAMLRGSYELASHLSDSVKELIKTILQFHPERRPNPDEILKHAWFHEMENHLNTFLTIEKAILPKDIQKKIGAAPPPPVSPISRKDGGKRRKNNSLNFQQSSHNININLEINNYSIVGKHSKNKNNFHSQEKDSKETFDFCSFKDPYNSAKSKKSKMEAVNRSQLEPKKWQQELNGMKMLQKIKSAKSSKIMAKDMTSLEKKGHAHGPDTTQKKKGKFRRSEMQINDKTEKHPIRFNTEANQDCCQPPKLKKAGAGKNKLLSSCKSALRFHKNHKD